VDPLTREGIFFALRSADLLASALCGAAPGAMDRYAAALRREVIAELDRAARLKQGFFRGPFTRLLVDALGHSPAVSRIMADLVAGCQPYATLKRRLLATLEVGLAWQLLKLEVLGRLTRRARVTSGPARGAAGQAPRR
jgi:flavin-dependent dehydrogenase